MMSKEKALAQREIDINKRDIILIRADVAYKMNDIILYKKLLVELKKYTPSFCEHGNSYQGKCGECDKLDEEEFSKYKDVKSNK